MAVAANASVLPTTGTAKLAGLLALEHLAVLRNAMAVPLRDLVLGGGGLILGRGPGEVITADLNVIVGELAKLVVIHTEELSFLRCAKVQTRDEVDSVGEDSADGERVRDASNDVSELDVELLPVVFDPTTGVEASVDTVEADDVAGSEDAVGEETDHSSDAVLSEHVKGIVDLDPELDLSSKIAYYTGNDAKNDAAPGGDETRGRGCSNEARDTS